MWRSFARGTPSVPARGMREIPRQLAGMLPEGTLMLGARVTGVTASHASLAGGGSVTARHGVVVATDPRTAGALLPTLDVPPMNGVTTLYHAAPEPPLAEPTLVLDGEQRTIVNSVVMSAASAAYAPGDRALVSTSVLGVGHGEDLERRVRARLAELYGTDTSGWRHLATYPVADALPSMRPPQRRG